MSAENRNFELLWGVRRSVRYHTRRRSFYDRLNLTSNAVSVIFGSAAIYGVLKQGSDLIAIGAAVIVTVISSLNMVIGSTRMARLHEDLARRFINLEKMIVKAGSYGPEQYAQFVSERLEIETCEPPILRVLDSVCHNELLRADGHAPGSEHYVTITSWQRFCSPFFDWDEHRITKNS